MTNQTICSDLLISYYACNVPHPHCTHQQAEYSKYCRDVFECYLDVTDEQESKALSQFLRIELYVAATAILLSVLTLFGATRRRWDHQLVKAPVWLAYAFSSNLVYYAIGLMQSFSYHNKSFPFYTAFLVIALAKADSMTAYSLDDNEQRRRFLSTAVLHFFLACYLIASYLQNTKYYWILCVLFVWGSMKAVGTAGAMESASVSSGLARSSKLVFEFMEHEHEHEHSGGSPDPLTMTGYNYLVAGEEKVKVVRQPPSYVEEVPIEEEKVITLHKVWLCQGRLITNYETGNRCKDLCLSYALFRLICCKFGGYSLPNCTREKSWNLIRHGLISDSEQVRGHKRLFRVIEVELAFLYDFFYTKYPHSTSRTSLVLRILELIFVGLGCCAALFTLTPRVHKKNRDSVFMIDTVVTVIVIVSMLLMQLVQLFYVITSDWLKVKLICRYVRKTSWWIEKKMIEVICSHKWKPWSRRMKQYSLLVSYPYTPSSIVYNCIVTLFAVKPRNGQKQSREIGLPEGVKRAVVDWFLKLESPRALSNGIASVQRNGFGDQLGWAFDRSPTTTHVILVWHIATSYCEMKTSTGHVRNSEQFIVANGLSQYCAYLVAFLPKLLPDHPCITETIFDEAIKEARDSLKKCKTEPDKLDGMRELGRQENHNSIIEKGAKLGLCLEENTDINMRWKVLADFWTEHVLFLAPTGELKSHAEQLASGGEFLTHLMALLFHAGIDVDRCSASQHL